MKAERSKPAVLVRVRSLFAVRCIAHFLYAVIHLNTFATSTRCFVGVPQRFVRHVTLVKYLPDSIHTQRKKVR